MHQGICPLAARNLEACLVNYNHCRLAAAAMEIGPECQNVTTLLDIALTQAVPIDCIGIDQLFEHSWAILP